MPGCASGGTGEILPPAVIARQGRHSYRCDAHMEGLPEECRLACKYCGTPCDHVAGRGYEPGRPYWSSKCFHGLHPRCRDVGSVSMRSGTPCICPCHDEEKRE